MGQGARSPIWIWIVRETLPCVYRFKSGQTRDTTSSVHLEAALIPETGGTRVMRRDYSRCALVDVETLRHPRRYCQFGNQDCVTDCRWCGGAARNALAPSVQKYRRVGEEDGDCQVDESAIWQGRVDAAGGGFRRCGDIIRRWLARRLGWGRSWDGFWLGDGIFSECLNLIFAIFNKNEILVWQFWVKQNFYEEPKYVYIYKSIAVTQKHFKLYNEIFCDLKMKKNW